MKRARCLEMIYPEIQDDLVVTIMGAVAQELHDLGHRENFFYLQHAMGLAWGLRGIFRRSGSSSWTVTARRS